MTPQSRLRRASSPYKGEPLDGGGTDCHSQCAHWFRNDRLQGVRCWPGGGVRAPRPTHDKECGGAGRCGERTERRQWRMKRSERVAAVKILSVRRKAAQKFRAPQQGHRPLRKRCLRLAGRALSRGAVPSTPQSASLTAPLAQGSLWTGGTDCHSQCAHWLRNDRLQGVRYKPGQIGAWRGGLSSARRQDYF